MWWSPALPLPLHAVSTEPWSPPSISRMLLCRWAQRYPPRSGLHSSRTWHPATMPQAGAWCFSGALVCGTPPPHFPLFLADHSHLSCPKALPITTVSFSGLAQCLPMEPSPPIFSPTLWSLFISLIGLDGRFKCQRSLMLALFPRGWVGKQIVS